MDGPLGDAQKLPTRELAGDVSQEGLRMSLPGADTPMIMRMDLTLERPVSPCRRQGRGLGGDVCKTLSHYLIKVSERRATSSTFSL